MGMIGLSAYKRCALGCGSLRARVKAYFDAEQATVGPLRVAEIILGEEEQALRIFHNIRRHAARVVGEVEVTPQLLARLYDERGWWPEFVCDELGVEYTAGLDLEWREAHRQLQRGTIQDKCERPRRNRDT